MNDPYEQIQWLQEQIRELQRGMEQLQMEHTLLQNDLNTLKTEGCWRFVEDKNHKHRGVDE
jgi:prefoldin subunit 5